MRIMLEIKTAVAEDYWFRVKQDCITKMVDNILELILSCDKLPKCFEKLLFFFPQMYLGLTLLEIL